MRRETLAAVMAVAANMPSAVPVTADADMLYELGLADMDDEDILYGVRHCLQHCTFRPMPAEIRAAVVARDAPPPIDADEVFGTITALVRRYGLYGKRTEWGFTEGDPPYPSDVVRAVVLNLGGWKAVCMWDSGDASLRNAVVSAVAGTSRRAAAATTDTGTDRRLRGAGGLTAIGGAD